MFEQNNKEYSLLPDMCCLKFCLKLINFKLISLSRPFDWAYAFKVIFLFGSNDVFLNLVFFFKNNHIFCLGSGFSKNIYVYLNEKSSDKVNLSSFMGIHKIKNVIFQIVNPRAISNGFCLILHTRTYKNWVSGVFRSVDKFRAINFM